MASLKVRLITPKDKTWIKQVMEKNWGSVIMVASETFNTLELPGLIAEYDGTPQGILTYHVKENSCEIVTLNSFLEKHGIGTALIEQMKKHAKENGYKNVWLGTTNDNLDGLKFYQKRGLRIIKVLPNEVEKARKIKPEIPEIGYFDIPIRDVIELEYKIEA